jgi:hypothetical protein
MPRQFHRQTVPRGLLTPREQGRQRDVGSIHRLDDAARSDLRLLNEQNALRFEAKLDQRIAELRAEMEKLGARLDGRLDAQAPLPRRV